MATTVSAAGEPSPWLTAQEAAARARFSVRTLENWRRDGGGPEYSRRGGRVLYHAATLDAWLAAGVARHTAQERLAGVKMAGGAIPLQEVEA